SLAFIERELRVSEDIDTIIVADRPLAQCLRRHLENLSRPVAIRCTESPYARVWRISRPVRQYLISFTVLMLRFLGRSKSYLARLPRNTRLTLVDTFVLNNKSGDEGSIVNGKYKDRYYPGLLENLSKDERGSV